MPGPEQMLDREDAKILTLARVAQQRSYAPYTGVGEGAAVRDTDGRTYAAATVENADERLTLSAVRAALAAAVSSGARRFEAIALVSPHSVLCADDVATVAEFGGPTPVLLAALDGVLVRTVHVGAEADRT